MAQEWDIKPRGTACQACQKPFEDGERYFSMLVFGDEGYARGDYCEACRQSKAQQTAPYSVWQGVFRLPPPAPEEPLRKETAESLLRHLMEDQDASRTSIVFILAVMLERKRLLVERDVQTHEDGTMTRVYEHRKTGESFVIPDPRLRLDQLEDVQQQVIAMLSGEKNEGSETPKAEPSA